MYANGNDEKERGNERERKILHQCKLREARNGHTAFGFGSFYFWCPCLKCCYNFNFSFVFRFLLISNVQVCAAWSGLDDLITLYAIVNSHFVYRTMDETNAPIFLL